MLFFSLSTFSVELMDLLLHPKSKFNNLFTVQEIINCKSPFLKGKGLYNACWF